MYKVNRIEVYITHVCNLNCKGCNRFNNFAFEGHKSSDEALPLLEQWGEMLEIDNIKILGGEPMVHPEFETWVRTVARICAKFGSICYNERNTA